MKFKYVYLFALLSIIILFLTDTLLQKTIFIVLFLLLQVLYKIKVKFKMLTFGLYFSTFIVLFNWLITTNFRSSLVDGLDSFFMFIVIVQISLVLKHFLSNKQLAYCITKTLSPLKIFGFNENYFYTIMLLALNQIYYLAAEAKQMYNFAVIDSKAFNKSDKIKLIIDLIIPFIFISLRKNQIISISILNKGYNINNKKLFILNYKDINNSLLKIITLILSLELLTLGVL